MSATRVTLTFDDQEPAPLTCSVEVDAVALDMLTVGADDPRQAPLLMLITGVVAGFLDAR